MGKEKGPEFYTGEGYLKDGSFEHNKIIYETAINLLDDKPIIELACGVGYFASIIDDNKYIHGIDFSQKVIDIAKSLNPKKLFFVKNLNDDDITNLYIDDCTYICIEALEHIKKDIEVLEKIPSGSTIIFSVPNRDYTSHVRHFNDVTEVADRYSCVLDFNMAIWDIIDTNPKKGAKVFMCKARRK